MDRVLPRVIILPFFIGSSLSTEPLIMKRKRGRPRILDAPGEINPFAQIIEGNKHYYLIYIF